MANRVSICVESTTELKRNETVAGGALFPHLATLLNTRTQLTLALSYATNNFLKLVSGKNVLVAIIHIYFHVLVVMPCTFSSRLFCRAQLETLTFSDFSQRPSGIHPSVHASGF